MKTAKSLLLSALAALVAVAPSSAFETRRQQIALFVGIDVSASFRNTGNYNDALRFLARYIHGHLHGIGDVEPVKALFVGSIGGNNIEEAKSFRPIEDFKGRSIEQIEASLKSWFPKGDSNTDFDAFFHSVSMIAQKRNLALTPIEVVLVTDGIPDTPGEKETRIANVNVKPLEFLARRVTLRLLYPTATVCSHWETRVDHKRLRMWTVDDQVMSGWSRQLESGVPPSQQKEFWKWVLSNVDFRVRPVKFAPTPMKPAAAPTAP